MPAKKPRRGRRPQYKKPAGQPTAAPATHAAAAAQANAVNTAPAPVKAPAAKPAGKIVAYTPSTTAEYPFFTRELKRITILSVAILAILIILAVVIK
jgi:hypothetical protein